MGNDSVPKLTIKDTPRHADSLACTAIVVLNAVWLLTLRLPFFHVDDASYIVENPYVRNGLSCQSLSWAFTTSFGDYWHPLAWISLSLDSTVFGTNPWGYHLTNALLHMANAVLVYLFFRRSTGMLWRSLLAAALFSLHPERVESVAWATERKDVLAGFFGLLALLVYLRFTRETRGKKSGWYLLLCGLFVFSMLAKPLLVTFPVLLLLLDVWPLGRWSWTGAGGGTRGLWLLVREKVLLFLLAFAGALNTYMYVFTKGSFRGSPSMGVKNAGLNYVLYLRDFVWPAWLSFFYRTKPNFPSGRRWRVGVGGGNFARRCRRGLAKVETVAAAADRMAMVHPLNAAHERVAATRVLDARRPVHVHPHAWADRDAGLGNPAINPSTQARPNGGDGVCGDPGIGYLHGESLAVVARSTIAL